MPAKRGHLGGEVSGKNVGQSTYVMTITSEVALCRGSLTREVDSPYKAKRPRLRAFLLLHQALDLTGVCLEKATREERGLRFAAFFLAGITQASNTCIPSVAPTESLNHILTTTT